MLKINRLRVEIETENGIYGVDEEFAELDLMSIGTKGIYVYTFCSM